MKLLAQRIERQFKRNHRQHVFANELVVKIQRMRECFSGNSLPLPTAEVIAAWNDLPNDTTDILPMSMKTELVFLRAPPPTPTGLAFDTDADDDIVTSDGLSLDGSLDDGWLFVDDTESPTSDAAEFRAPECFTASEEDSASRCGHPDRSSDRQSHEEYSPRSTDSNTLSSDRESHSSGSRASRTPVGFYNMVNQWLLDYRARGTDPFVESLIAFGVVSMGSAPLASRIARAIIRKVAKTSHREGQSLENAIRFSALAAFKRYWDSNDTWMEMSSAGTNTMPPTPYGLNISSFMGSLFAVKIFSTRDIHYCLSFLSEGEKRIDRLCAMHALLVQANDKLCKSRNLPALMQFKDGISSRDIESGEFLWVTTPHSKKILADILALIERWMVSQSLRRDRYRMSAGNRNIRRRAVGPRLRDGGLEVGTV